MDIAIYISRFCMDYKKNVNKTIVLNSYIAVARDRHEKTWCALFHVSMQHLTIYLPMHARMHIYSYTYSYACMVYPKNRQKYNSYSLWLELILGHIIASYS